MYACLYTDVIHIIIHTWYTIVTRFKVVASFHKETFGKLSVGHPGVIDTSVFAVEFAFEPTRLCVQDVVVVDFYDIVSIGRAGQGHADVLRLDGRSHQHNDSAEQERNSEQTVHSHDASDVLKLPMKLKQII